MSILENYTIAFLVLQLFHSAEELSQGFHKRFPFGKLTFKNFLTFEVLFMGLWLTIFMVKSFPYRENILAFYLLLMFANGIWHIVWWGIEKKYVPGLITAPFFILVFVVYYNQLIH